MSGTVDAHLHVWDLSRAEYPWLADEDPRLDRTFTIAEALTPLRAAGIARAVLVQAADSDVETDYLFEVAESTPEVVGVVGYVPLEDPDRVAVRLPELMARPLFRGVRSLVHDRPDPDWLLRADVDAGLALLEQADVPFDVVGVLPEHLRAVLAISERHPRLRMVLDHLNKPPIGRVAPEPWASLVTAVAANPLVFGKVSGLYSAVGARGDWTVDSVRPFVEHALDVFGADRLMYGGDWPMSLTAGGYARLWAGTTTLLSGLAPAEEQSIRAGTAERFYRLHS